MSKQKKDQPIEQALAETAQKLDRYISQHMSRQVNVADALGKRGSVLLDKLLSMAGELTVKDNSSMSVDESSMLFLPSYPNGRMQLVSLLRNSEDKPDHYVIKKTCGEELVVSKEFLFELPQSTR